MTSEKVLASTLKTVVRANLADTDYPERCGLIALALNSYLEVRFP